MGTAGGHTEGLVGSHEEMEGRDDVQKTITTLGCFSTPLPRPPARALGETSLKLLCALLQNTGQFSLALSVPDYQDDANAGVPSASKARQGSQVTFLMFAGSM